MKPFLKSNSAPIILAFAVIIGIWIGRIIPGNGNNNPVKSFSSKSENKLNWILDLMDKDYVDKVNKDSIIETIIPKIFEDLDPHSVYIPAKDLEAVNEELGASFGGIGIQFNIQEDTIMVVNVVSGGPSERIGIMPGDRIVMVNDTSVAGVKIKNDDVLKKLRGTKGTKVKVSVARPGFKNKIDFEIERGTIPLYSIDASYKVNSTTGYIKVGKFARNTYEEFVVALTKLKKEGCTSLIIDLRANQGGYLDAVIRMVNEFLSRGDLIVYTEGKSQPRSESLSNGAGSAKNMRVVVLIDEWSASASEIFSGAIQDNDRGVIIGRRSFGKGLVQNQMEYTDGSAIRLTIARYYTPAGRCIQKPYTKGNEDYQLDIWNRYKNGEMQNADSIHLDKSKKYFTRNGRKVFGGGGIMPDIFVPRDTSDFTEYYEKLIQKGIMYRYAFKYTDQNRSSMQSLKTAAQIETWLNQNKFMDGFPSFSDANGVKVIEKQYQISKNAISTDIMAYIARNILDNDGFYPIINQADPTYKKAIEVTGMDDASFNALLHTDLKK